MSDSLEKENNSSESEELSPEPLGIKNPLESPTPLGQSFLVPKFITPLGTRTISRLKGNFFDTNEILIQNFSDRFSNFQERSLSSNINYETPEIPGNTSLSPDISPEIQLHEEDSVNQLEDLENHNSISNETGNKAFDSNQIKSTSQLQKQTPKNFQTINKKSIVPQQNISSSDPNQQTNTIRNKDVEVSDNEPDFRENFSTSVQLTPELNPRSEINQELQIENTENNSGRTEKNSIVRKIDPALENYNLNRNSKNSNQTNRTRLKSFIQQKNKDISTESSIEHSTAEIQRDILSQSPTESEASENNAISDYQSSSTNSTVSDSSIQRKELNSTSSIKHSTAEIQRDIVSQSSIQSEVSGNNAISNHQSSRF